MEVTLAATTIVVMGVSGSGKSTVGAMLAKRLGFSFLDADTLHPAQNVSLMASGHALTDEERIPWLHAVGVRLSRDVYEHGGAVAACSALTRAYRDVLREHVPHTFFVELFADHQVVAERVAARHHEFMPPSLLASQFATLEDLDADERGTLVSVTAAPDEVVDHILASLQA